MKKIVLLALVVLLVLTSIVVPTMAEELNPTHIVGHLTESNMSEDNIDVFLQERFEAGWVVFDENHASHFEYYDDLSSLLLALNAGTVDEITLPRFVAEYVVKNNPELQICCVQSMPDDMTLHFGFLDDEKGNDLRTRVNEAIAAMKGDGTLDALTTQYLKPGAGEMLMLVQFESFPESDETVRVAVTGDLPPIDYIGEDGIPAGFNTAVLAEVGRRLGVNIELVSMQAGSRALALTSGTADAVFWFMWSPTVNNDTPEGLVFSDSYLSWDMWLHINKAEK